MLLFSVRKTTGHQIEFSKRGTGYNSQVLYTVSREYSIETFTHLAIWWYSLGLVKTRIVGIHST